MEVEITKYRFLIGFLMLALAAAAAFQLTGAIGSLPLLTRTDSTDPIEQVGEKWTTTTSESCILIEVKAPEGVRGLKCWVPATVDGN